MKVIRKKRTTNIDEAYISSENLKDFVRERETDIIKFKIGVTETLFSIHL